MRIVFAGTPEYAVPSLKALAGLKPRHEVVAVVTQPDRPKGRSKTPTPPPVKAAALELGIPPERIFQKSINKPEVLDALRALAPDVLCVVAYGGLLKKDALALAKRYPINAHGSLLPKFRGAAPIQAAILAGERETGVCIMKMEEGLDSGPVMLRRAIPIEQTDTAGTLHDKLSALSAECFVEALAELETGAERFDPQDHTAATCAPKLAKDSGTIDWSQSAEQIERFLRAMTPWPGAWTVIHSADGKTKKRLRLADAFRIDNSIRSGNSNFGEVVLSKAVLPFHQVRSVSIRTGPARVARPVTPAAICAAVGIPTSKLLKALFTDGKQLTVNEIIDDDEARSIALKFDPISKGIVIETEPEGFAEVREEKKGNREYQCIDVSCGDGSFLRITSIQPEGAREMRVEEFLNGAGRVFVAGARMG